MIKQGEITAIVDKTSAGGKTFSIVKLDGSEEGAFDWNNFVKEGALSVGDQVEIVSSGGKYPRINAVRKLPKPAKQQELAKETIKAVSREASINKAVALKAAVEMAVAKGWDKFTIAEMVKRTLEIADEFEEWLYGAS